MTGNFHTRLAHRQPVRSKTPSVSAASLARASGGSRPVRSKTPSVSAASLARASNGSSLLEILIAVTILSLGIGAVLLLSTANQDLKIDSQTNGEALSKAEGMIETARALSRQDFYSISAIAPANDDIYTKSIDVTDIDVFTKQVTSNVAWSASASRPVAIRLTTILTDPQSALGGDTCNPVLSGDWTDPQLLGYADFPSSQGATGVDVLAHKAYVTTDPTGNSEDFYTFDVSNPNQTHIPFSSKLETGPGLAAVKVAGRYAYVANTANGSQLQVIDISQNPPAIVAELDLTSSGTADGSTLYYANRKVYVGLTKSTGPEFFVINVSSPTTLSASDILGSYEFDTTVNSIAVKDDRAYVATPMPTSNPPTQENLTVLNLSTNPISRLATFSWPIYATMDGLGVYYGKDDRLYLGRTAGGNQTTYEEFFILDPDPSSIATPIAKKFIPDNNNGKAISIGSLIARQNLVFILTSDTNLGFQIWDLGNLSSANPYGSLNVQQSSTAGMDCEGNLIFIGQQGNRALQIIGPGP